MDEILFAMPDASIHAMGIISEKVNPVLYRVILPNGKSILAHFSKPLLQSMPLFENEQRVVVELTTFDFDQGRILGAMD